MNALAGLFLIGHGLVHLAVWLPSPKEDAPFDPARSWLVRDARGAARFLAIVACALFVVAGILVLASAGLGAAIAIAAAAVSLGLVGLTFNRWLVAAIAIDVAVVAVALG